MLFIIIFAFAISLIMLICKTPFIKGFIGESIVKIIIGKTSEKQEKEKYIINNFLIQLEEGHTSQTDHILINKNGVFVIETKNYSGRIYGDDSRKEWTQVLNYGKVKNKFYSPVNQNFTHIHHIKKLLPEGTPIFSVVVFIKGNTHYINSKYVYNLLGLYRMIHTKNDIDLSPDQMKFLYTALCQNNKSDIINNTQHVQNIQEMQNKIANNICPRCGSALVERKGKNGNFIGCSNYPKCTFTHKLK